MTIDIKSFYFSIEMNENNIFNTDLSINYIMKNGSLSSLELQFYIELSYYLLYITGNAESSKQKPAKHSRLHVSGYLSSLVR